MLAQQQKRAKVENIVLKSQEILDTFLHYLGVLGTTGNLTVIIILNKGFSTKVLETLEKLNIGT
jgi:hypothetical protein